MPCPFAFTLNVLSSGWTDAIVLTATAPLERLVLLQQVNGVPNQEEGFSIVLSGSSTVRTATSVASLWQGNGIRILHSVLGRTLSQWSQSWWVKRLEFLQQQWYQRHSPTNSSPKPEPPSESEKKRQVHIWASFAAGVTSFVVLYPLQFAVLHMTLDAKVTSASLCLTQAATQHGLLSLYRGLGISLMSFLANRLIAFGVYPYVYQRANGGGDTWVTLVTDILAHAVTFAGTTLGRRRQLQDVLDTTSTDVTTTNFSTLYSGFSLDCFKLVVQKAITTFTDSVVKSDAIRRMLMQFFH